MIKGPLPVLVALLAAGCTAARDRLDENLAQRCAADGGVVVFERATLPAQWIEQNGWAIPPEDHARSTDPYFRRDQVTNLVTGNPELFRVVAEVIRGSDGKVMARGIRYIRRGVHAPIPMHWSVKACPPEGLDIESKVFG